MGTSPLLRPPNPSPRGESSLKVMLYTKPSSPFTVPRVTSTGPSKKPVPLPPWRLMSASRTLAAEASAARPLVCSPR